MSLTEVQKKYVNKNLKNMSAEEMAKKLRISKKRISDYMSGKDDDSEAIGIYDSQAWLNLKEELSGSEMKYFEEAYKKYTSQMQDDVFGTEETQIFILIKLEIMMHRNAKGKRQAVNDLADISSRKEKFLKSFKLTEDMSADDRDYITELDNQMAQIRLAEAQKSSEFIKLSDDHQKILRDLKGTRDQRMTRVESAKDSFLKIIAELQDEDIQNDTTRQMELVKRATAKERDRLSKVHEYEDGREDLPILNADTVENYEDN